MLPNGVAKCRGGCVISSSLLHFNEVPFVCAFSFDICALESKNTPEIQFGIKHNGLTKLDFNYFALLASIRADSLRPHIPSDGLGVPIRLLVDKTNVRLYVNEVLCPMNYALDSNSMSFYLKVQADEAIILMNLRAMSRRRPMCRKQRLRNVRKRMRKIPVKSIFLAKN